MKKNCSQKKTNKLKVLMVNSKVPMRRKLTPSTNFGRTSPKTSNSAWSKTTKTDRNWLSLLGGTPPKIWLNCIPLTNTYQEWNRVKSISTTWVVKKRPFSLSLLWLKNSPRKATRSFWVKIHSTRLFSTPSDNINLTESSTLLELTSRNLTRLTNLERRSNISRKYILLWLNMLKISWKTWSRRSKSLWGWSMNL